MKVRAGLVSNSSSSSFVINRSDITSLQEKLIHEHYKESVYDECDNWNITVDDYAVRGSTIMDNFDMAEYLKEIGVDMECVTWES